MKKLTIKNVFTKVEFKEAIMKDDVLTVVDRVEVIMGKVNEKKALASLDGKDYLVKSVVISQEINTYKIPYDVLETLLNASLNGGFVEIDEPEVNEETGEKIPVKTSLIQFNNELFIKSEVSPLGVNRVEIVEKDEAIREVNAFEDGTEIRSFNENYNSVTGVSVPRMVYQYVCDNYMETK